MTIYQGYFRITHREDRERNRAAALAAIEADRKAEEELAAAQLADRRRAQLQAEYDELQANRAAALAAYRAGMQLPSGSIVVRSFARDGSDEQIEITSTILPRTFGIVSPMKTISTKIVPSKIATTRS